MREAGETQHGFQHPHSAVVSGTEHMHLQRPQPLQRRETAQEWLQGHISTSPFAHINTHFVHKRKQWDQGPQHINRDLLFTLMFKYLGIMLDAV